MTPPDQANLADDGLLSAPEIAMMKLNADLVVAGVLFHDIGKLWENSYPKQGFSMPHQEMGELLSHIPLGISIHYI